MLLRNDIENKSMTVMIILIRTWLNCGRGKPREQRPLWFFARGLFVWPVLNCPRERVKQSCSWTWPPDLFNLFFPLQFFPLSLYSLHFRECSLFLVSSILIAKNRGVFPYYSQLGKILEKARCKSRDGNVGGGKLHLWDISVKEQRQSHLAEDKTLQRTELD